VSILTFAGTDPVSLAVWIVDFSIHPNVDAVHASFEAGVDAAWKTISAVLGVGGASATDKLFITGASLILALVIVQAIPTGGLRAIPATKSARSYISESSRRTAESRWWADDADSIPWFRAGRPDVLVEGRS
jgi:hypothetical protein